MDIPPAGTALKPRAKNAGCVYYFTTGPLLGLLPILPVESYCFHRCLAASNADLTYAYRGKDCNDLPVELSDDQQRIAPLQAGWGEQPDSLLGGLNCSSCHSPSVQPLRCLMAATKPPSAFIKAEEAAIPQRAAPEHLAKAASHVIGREDEV
jgi:hypothetical protein